MKTLKRYKYAFVCYKEGELGKRYDAVDMTLVGTNTVNAFEKARILMPEHSIIKLVAVDEII